MGSGNGALECRSWFGRFLVVSLGLSFSTCEVGIIKEL